MTVNLRISGLCGMLFKPDRYFSDLKDKPADLKIPLLIVLLWIVSTIVPVIYLVDGITVKNTPGSQFLFIGVALITIMLYLLIFCMYWLLLSGILFSLSYVFRASGSFKKMIEFAGMGFLPVALTSVLFFIEMMCYLVSRNGVYDSSVSQGVYMLNVIQGNPLSIIFQLLSLISIIWCGYIWVYGVKNARNISLRKSIIVAGIPVVVYLLYTIINLKNMYA